MKKLISLFPITIVALLFSTAPAQPDLVAGQLTHLYYTPTPYVNPGNHLVVGLHEISYSLDGRLQFQLSLLDNIGHVNLGAKYQLADALAIGGGLAGSFAHVGHFGRHRHHHHGVHYKSSDRLGLYLVGKLVNSTSFEAAYTLHT